MTLSLVILTLLTAIFCHLSVIYFRQKSSDYKTNIIPFLNQVDFDLYTEALRKSRETLSLQSAVRI